MEASNIFHGRVFEPYIDRYRRSYINNNSALSRKRTDAIIPDILVDNFPSKNFCTNVEDGRHGAVPAIFEIKGIRVCKTRYKLQQNAVEERASKVVPEYIKRAHTCDTKYASEAMRSNPSTPGPFENAIRSFATGGPIPLIVGGFSEVNTNVIKVLTHAAKFHSTSPEGLLLSPERSTTGSHGSFSLLKSLFRRIIGCAAARANADLKLRRKHYVRSTLQGAIQAAQYYSTRSSYTTSNSWYAQNDPNTRSQFAAFYDFRSSYKDFLHPTFGKQYQYAI